MDQKNKANKSKRSKKRHDSPRRRGHVQMAILHLLTMESMHGYQIIKELERRTNGLYKPSAGTIYPALQELLEKNWITIDEKTDKKTYSINKMGSDYLLEVNNSEMSEEFWSHWKQKLIWKNSDEAALLKEELAKWKSEVQKAKGIMMDNPSMADGFIWIIAKSRMEMASWRNQAEPLKDEENHV